MIVRDKRGRRELIICDDRVTICVRGVNVPIYVPNLCLKPNGYILNKFYVNFGKKGFQKQRVYNQLEIYNYDGASDVWSGPEVYFSPPRSVV